MIDDHHVRYWEVPDRTTRSLTLKPTDWNDAFNWVMFMKGAGSLFKASEALETVPSLRPNSTCHDGPLICKKTATFSALVLQVYTSSKFKIWKSFKIFTKVTASRATNATISAQETTPGHFFSTADFTASITWNPLRNWFGIAAFSAWLLEVEFNRTEPSHPCK